jgi:excisionase family DNA binding protein
MTNRIERLAFSPEETANRLGVSLRMVHYAIKRGDVATRKLGRRVLIPRSELLRISGEKVISLEGAR